MKKMKWSTNKFTHKGLLFLCALLILPALVYIASTSVAAKKQTVRQNQVQRKAEAPQISQGALADFERQSNPEMVSRSAQVSADETGRPSTDPEPNFPPLGTNTFDGINFNEDASITGFFQIPPDPAGAAGTTHVVNVVNSAIEWYTKAGVRQNRQTLTSFFAGAPSPPQTLTFDPKVVYDHYADRFIVVTMERVEASGMIPNQSRVYVAVSDNGDPNGTWFFQTLQTEETINGRQSWADFPGLAFDIEAVYFTTNMFAHNNQTQAGVFQGQRLWIIPKLPLYSGGASVLNRLDPAALATANSGAGDGFALATTMQPTIIYNDFPGELGTYLVAYSGINDFVSGSDANLFIQIIRVDNPLGVNGPPTCTGFFSQWGTIQQNDNLFSGLPGAPQNLTTRRIATNDRRLSQNAVYRNNLLYFAAPVLEPTASTEAGQVSAHWFIIDPAVVLAGGTATDPPPVTHGDIGGEEIAPGTYTFFPSVAVSSGGDLGVSFAASAPTIFAGSYFAGRLFTDAAGTIRPASTLRAGQDRYIRDFTTSMTVTSRWGDYTGTAIDPVDNTTFWSYNEHALPRGTVLGGLPEEDGRWGTAWGNFSLTAPSVPPASLPLIISEFRNRGPNGETDEFIEIYNNSDTTQRVVAIDGSNGFAVVAQDGVTRCVIPNGTLFPARGHYICASPAYSLAAYASANIYYFTPDITDTQGIALFNSSTPANFTLANRLDAFGYSSSPPLYREGAGFPIILTFNTQHTFYRDLNTVGGTPKDTGDNGADFISVNANPEIFNYGIPLGAPGPENLTSPLNRSATMPVTLFDTGAGATSPPNQERITTPVTNGSLGTLILRRTVTNGTGAAVTRLRFRVIDITTFQTPQSPTLGQPAPCGPPICSDLRVLSSSDETAVATSTGPKDTKATILEAPPAQPNGGGYNSSLNVPFVSLGSPLANGASVNVVFRLGVNREGTYRFLIIVEALP